MAKKDVVQELRRVRNRLKGSMKPVASDAAILTSLNDLVSAASGLSRAKKLDNETWIEFVWSVGLLGQSAAQQRRADKITSQEQALSAIGTVLESLRP